jgi:hypothetical protein
LALNPGSPEERRLFSKTLTEQEHIDRTWRCEACAVHCGRSATSVIRRPDHIGDPAQVVRLIAEKSFQVHGWIQPLYKRDTGSPIIYRYAWQSRARLHNEDRHPVELQGLQRHYTLNWLIRFSIRMDDVTTDT